MLSISALKKWCEWPPCAPSCALQQPAEAAPAGAAPGVAQTDFGARALLESSSEQWGKAAALPGVAVALELLAAVAKGHQASCGQKPELEWPVIVVVQSDIASEVS